MNVVRSVRSNPNASASVGFGGLGLLVVWGAGQLGVDLSNEAAVTIAAALTSAGLLVGRRGIRGVIRLVWRGDEKESGGGDR